MTLELHDDMEICTPVKVETLSAKEYKKMMESPNANLVESIRFILPKPGKSGFGKFVVEYKIPILKKKNAKFFASTI